MKRLVSIIMVTALLLGFTGVSMAAMSNLNLYMAVYTTTGTMESVTDLGTIGGEINLNAKNQVLSSINALSNLSLYGDGTTFNNLRVAYFAVNNLAGTNNDEAWVTGDSTRNTRGFTNINNMFSYMADNPPYINLFEGQTLFSAKDGLNSYFRLMSAMGTAPGYFGNFSGQCNGEVTLGPLAGVGYVDQILYYYTYTGGNTGIAAATIRTYANGNVVINYSTNPVPVPPGIFLLAPGLLGLIGLRKRFTKA